MADAGYHLRQGIVELDDQRVYDKEYMRKLTM